VIHCKKKPIKKNNKQIFLKNIIYFSLKIIIYNRKIKKMEEEKIERDCMRCEKTFFTTNKENADYCEECK
jgi:hypothetical protein